MVTALRPGVVVTSRSDPPPRGLRSDTGTWFVVGAAQKGPTTSAQLVTSLSQFVTYFGARQTYSVLFDAIETFFREGGQAAYVVRVAGASAVSASHVFLDASAGNSLLVTAKNPGVWGNGLSVAVTQPQGGYFQLTVTQSGVVVDQSGLCVTQADAINWSRNSAWVTVSLPSSPSALPPAVVGAAALTSGADDNAGITDNQRQAALAFFTADLGGGQVSMPGNVTTANRTALIVHATAFGRQAILDNTDAASRATAVSEASSLQAVGNEYGALFGPWVVVPGLIPGTTRIVPPSALVAGLIARSDAANTVNQPAMATNGQARFAVDVTQPAWSDTDRDLLNAAGLNVIRTIAQQGVQLYGFRTLTNSGLDASWLALSNQRLRQQITIEAQSIAQGFVGQQIDGKGRTVAQFGNALKDLLMQHYLEGALFGDTPDDAYSVDVGSSVNTVATLQNNELHAVISLRMSPFAELVAIEIVKVGIAQSL